MMRGTPLMRIAFAVLSPIFLGLALWAVYREQSRPWIEYQQAFKQQYLERIDAKLAAAAEDAAEQARWRRVRAEVERSEPEIVQYYIQELGVTDRCPTCHRGIDNPLFVDAPQPFRTHPGTLLRRHDVSRFGCTPCHDGQGIATSVEAGHGRVPGWHAPLLPAAYVETTCVRCHDVTQGLPGAEIVSRGTALFIEKGCYGCHEVKALEGLPRYSPPLSALAAKFVDPARWVLQQVQDPERVHPDGAMPQFRLANEEVADVTAFLLRLSDPAPEAGAPTDTSAAEEGERLFRTRGCASCHAVRVDEHSVASRVPNLAGIGSRARPDWLERWVTRPRDYNPDTGMPTLDLTDAERGALVAYLLTLTVPAPPPAPDLSHADPENGRRLVQRYECFGCHAIRGFEQARPSVPDLAEFANRHIDDLDFATVTDLPRTKWDWLRRKLQEPRAYETERIKLKMPLVRLRDEENRALITSALSVSNQSWPPRYMVRATPADRARRDAVWMTGHYNCRGCHRLDGADPRVAKLVDRRSLVPPTLDGIGARLQGQFLYQFLLEPRQLRPWLQMRMPLFGFTDAQARTLTTGFAATAGVTNPYTYVGRARTSPEHRERGARRFKHFKCAQCHPASLTATLPEGVDPEDLSINLALTKTRLRPEWVKDFLARPKQVVAPDTRMPTIFYTVDGQPKVERPDDDIADITTYLMVMEAAPEAATDETPAPTPTPTPAVDWTSVQY